MKGDYSLSDLKNEKKMESFLQNSSQTEFEFF